MAEYVPFPVVFNEANRYADLEGIKADLNWIVEAAGEFVKTRINDSIIREAFTFAAVVKYGRVFNSGVRRAITKDLINNLESNFQKDHEEFMALRDRYVAHSVNNFEENYTQVYIKDPMSQNPEFNQISVMHNRVVSISVDDMNRLAVLAKELMDKIGSLMKAEKPKVEEIARRIPVTELIKRKYRSERDNVFKARKRETI
ncbi:MAG: hypothetical protein NTY14_03055 [Candidatus Omnitrophica bacterium]|nr:hypothetical protein [Candidatus Omnitrophota bacterium]